jgi:hypothetical protein
MQTLWKWKTYAVPSDSTLQYVTSPPVRRKSLTLRQSASRGSLETRTLKSVREGGLRPIWLCSA